MTQSLIDTRNPDFRQFIGLSQRMALIQFSTGEEGAYYRALLRDVLTTIGTMPRTYGQNGLGDDAIVYLHYFTGGCDWFITERDSESEQLQAFGLADLFQDGGELGYISLSEITQVGAELDLHWTPCTLRDCRSRRRELSQLAVPRRDIPTGRVFSFGAGYPTIKEVD